MKLGIDFGTCNSSAALLLDGTLKRIAEPLKHDYCFPSSVFITEQGEILVGHAAENARQKDPQRYRREFKRELGSEFPYILGNRQLLPEELVSAVLRKLRIEADKVVQGRGIRSLSDGIITVPATYQAYKRDIMQKAGIRAGFSQVELLEEPVAAAIYYSRHASVEEGEIILVYDLGGGTFDATLIQKQAAGYSILAMPRGLPHCGGRDFDREIYMHLKQQCSESLRQRLEDNKEWRVKAIVGDFCQQLKHQLSEAEEAEIYIPIGDGESYVLTRQVFNGMIEPLISETIDCCDQLVRSAGIEWQQVNQVLLVGGSCRIPYVQERVVEKFGRPHLLVDEPELAVCLGAAIYGLEDEEEVERQRREQEEQERQRRGGERLKASRSKLVIPNQPTSTFEFEVVTVAGVQRSGGFLGLGETVTLNLNRRRKQAQYYTESLPGGVSLEMVYIPGGKFLMGSPVGEGYDSEKPQHQVAVPPFFMGKYPVTQKQWRAVASLPKVKRYLNPDPSSYKGDNRPVEQVTWYDAVEFCKRLSQKTGRDYRLPSEAEWEYACRAGTATPFYFGATLSTDLANYDGNYTYGGGPKGIYRQETTSVGQFPPNAFGLYDLHGNVWEWCADTWHHNYVGAPTDGSAWLSDNENNSRLLRGGSWFSNPGFCRSASRLNYFPVSCVPNFGLRVVASSRT